MHNDKFDDFYYPGLLGLYDLIMDYAYHNGGWLVSCRELYEWWNNG